MQQKTNLLEWWRLIFEKRCDSCAHSQEDDYNEALKEFLKINWNVTNPRHPKNLTLGDEAPKLMWALFG
jgi:hypothetical protein